MRPTRQSARLLAKLNEQPISEGNPPELQQDDIPHSTFPTTSSTSVPDSRDISSIFDAEFEAHPDKPENNALQRSPDRPLQSLANYGSDDTRTDLTPGDCPQRVALHFPALPDMTAEDWPSPV